MATLVAAAQPGLFAAVGVHSGLAPDVAQSLPEGLAAMRGIAAMPARKTATPRHWLQSPTIVFHGDQDSTVHPSNGQQVIKAALADAVQANGRANTHLEREVGVSAHGQRYTRTLYGLRPALAEHWVLHGAGHAWSGGTAAGSYTDPREVDASREMLRFFLAQSPRIRP